MGVPGGSPPLFMATTLDATKQEEYDTCVVLTDGRVYASHREQREITFLNADLLRYLEFLVRVTRMYRLFDEATEGAMREAEYLEEVAGTHRPLQRLDPEALIDGVWWTGVVEELKMI